MDFRKQQEQIFHDSLRKDLSWQRWSPEMEEIIKTNPLWTNMKYYSVERKSRNMVLDWFAKNCKGERVLDYCCGNGDDSFIIAKNGAKEVIGIDISETSVNNCKKRAISEGCQKKVSFRVMDAEALEFNDNHFDIITEYGSLHHLNLQKAYSELARVLKPNGKILCNEALGHNPIIQLYRKITPHLRTKWEIEHIFRKRDLEMARQYFDKVEILGFFHLATIGATPFRNTPVFNFVLRLLEEVDGMLLKLPLVKWQAWQVVFVLSQPNKSPFLS